MCLKPELGGYFFEQPEIGPSWESSSNMFSPKQYPADELQSRMNKMNGMVSRIIGNQEQDAIRHCFSGELIRIPEISKTKTPDYVVTGVSGQAEAVVEVRTLKGVDIGDMIRNSMKHSDDKITEGSEKLLKPYGVRPETPRFAGLVIDVRSPGILVMD